MSVDSSSIVNVWDERNLKHSLQIEIPPSTAFTLSSSSNQLLAVNESVLQVIPLDDYSMAMRVNVRCLLIIAIIAIIAMENYLA